jgi:tetratricopeptide (TPR) repeat protein
MSNSKHSLVRLGACVALAFAVGCGDKGAANTMPEGASEGSGGEAAPAQPSDPAAASGGNSGAAAPQASGGTPQKPAAPANPWGSPDADQGAPLPARKALGGSAKSAYDSGVQLARNGKLSEARAQFDAAAKADPNAYEAVYALGVLSDREGKESQAIDYYRRALRIQADYERAAEGVATIYLRQGQNDKAVAFVRPLADQWQRNLAMQAVYADTLVAVGKPDDAIQVARKALHRDERFVPAMLSLVRANLRAGKLELADSILEQALAVDGNNAELHYLRGKRFSDEKRLADALNEFRKATELDPDNADARMELALRLLAGANYDEALQQLQVVAKLAPKLVEVQLALGEAYRCTRQWANAKAAYDSALRMRPQFPQVHYNLGLMYMTAGAEYPGMDLLTALGKAKEEFGLYRGSLAGKIVKDDPSTAYLEDIDKAVAREQKRIEREKKAAEKAARTSAENGASK